ncbi:glycosyltransferase family 2 protein [Caenispirillum bisanense]|uniref:Glycosyltransferase involved in cell wall bisynthesis n=1 Tax=Caenispirillum bisanense TaxID=414052 RepID=A0A286GM43_9PROT|nr:glycosyltransferase family 2 protein [Caenispirillum bisanense]SOD96159.1 Glycosyltransferase involved in cell wall bisynthesis [Caenispirillum bisanense]
MTAVSALVVAHNEEARLRACLEKLTFADEIVVVLDKCTDGTKAIAAEFTDRLVEGSWDLEGPRRNTGIAACAGPWVLEIDADEHVTPDLAAEIRRTVAESAWDWHELPVDNFIGGRLVRHGWGGSFGKSAYPGLFRKGVKTWGPQRVHPALTWADGARKGPRLAHPVLHYVDRDISDMVRRLDAYSTAKARDLRDAGETWGSTASNVRRLVSRFWKCYVSRKGYREGGYGLLIALFAGLYPLLSHLKATLERE